MNVIFQFVLASFDSPVNIGTTAKALLLALPLVAVISVVYKATKLEEIKLVSFLRESFLLFGSIIVFMIATAVVMFIIIKAVIG